MYFIIKKDKNTNNKLQILTCNNSFYKKLIQELYKRIILPFYIPLLFIIASFLILKSKNNLNYKFFKIKIFLMGILFVIFSQISVNLVSKNNFMSLTMVIIPLILIFFLILFFFRKKQNLQVKINESLSKILN